MVVLGLICCRGGSKGVPGKNIRPINGKPLIVYTIEVARQSKLIDAIVVSTDSEEIAQVARDAGVAVESLRPDHLANDSAGKWQVFQYEVEAFEKRTGGSVTLLVDLDATVPMKTVDDVDGAIAYCQEHDAADLVITAYEPERNPYFNMVELDNATECVSLCKTLPVPVARRQDAPQVLSLTGAVYVVKRDTLQNVDHWTKATTMVYKMDRVRAMDIDTELDFEIISLIMNRTKHQAHVPVPTTQKR